MKRKDVTVGLEVAFSSPSAKRSGRFYFPEYGVVIATDVRFRLNNVERTGTTVRLVRRDHNNVAVFSDKTVLNTWLAEPWADYIHCGGDDRTERRWHDVAAEVAATADPLNDTTKG